MSKQKNKGFVLILDLKTALLLGLMSAFSAVLVFYLGMSYGKSSRTADPGQVIVRSLEKPASGKADEGDSVFDPTNTGRTAESYEKALQQILAEEQNKANPVGPPAPPAPAKIEATGDLAQLASQSAPATAQAPAKASQPDDKFYTVQVLATSVYDKANDLSNTLKGKKYEAYIQSLPGESGNIIYRVRVGRGQLPEIEKLKAVLDNELKGLSQPKIYQVSN